ncbi:hypothetical protein F2Q69_00023668 [Brassica cretica]|uniref:Uncharacterized protein n=1 Tax=Brassica cretica TaxID=69181 RepID=A0A8S9QLW8_BRACR|nr:hypothetical protein F2Q69_00023668 [Brassica cretica]
MDPPDKDPDPDILKLSGYPIRPRPRQEWWKIINGDATRKGYTTTGSLYMGDEEALAFFIARLFQFFLARLPSFGLMTLGFGGFHSSASEAFDSASRFFGVDDGFSPRLSRFC